MRYMIFSLGKSCESIRPTGFLRIDDDQIVNVALVKNLQGFDGEGGVADANRVRRHDGLERARRELFVGRHLAAEIAVGEHAGEFAAGIDDREAADGAGHHEQGFLHEQIFLSDGVASAAVRMISPTRRSMARQSRRWDDTWRSRFV